MSCHVMSCVCYLQHGRDSLIVEGELLSPDGEGDGEVPVRLRPFLALILSAVKAAPLMRILLDILAVSGRMVTTGVTQASLVASY